MGVVSSSVTENQVVAAALALGIVLMLWFIDAASSLVGAPFDQLLVNLSLIGHFRPIATGSVFLSDVAYFITGTLFALFLATRWLSER